VIEMAASKKPVVKKGSQQAKLNAIGIDVVCELILGDASYATIAAQFGMTSMSLINWIEADPLRSTRAREARHLSAAQCDHKALGALEAIPDDGSPAQIARQREIASHYRWRAKTRNPRDYGDAMKLDADIKQTMTVDQVDQRLARLIEKTTLAIESRT